MAFWEDIPDALRNIFDDGLDEVLIFSVVFILILLSGHETNNLSECGDNIGILPLIIIAAFLLLFANISRTEESAA